MGETSIEWTDKTWNPVRGCSRVSTGCVNCYAEGIARRFSGPGLPYAGLTNDKGRWNGRIALVPEKLADPLRWRKPARVFVNSMSDLFHENVSFEYIAAVFGVMAAAEKHTFQVLTKRPQRALEFFAWLAAQRGVINGPLHTCLAEALIAAGMDEGFDPDDRHSETLCGRMWPLDNVWLGVSAENQDAADERIPLLLKCPAAVRFISAEPLLGPLTLDADWLYPRCPECNCHPLREQSCMCGRPGIATGSLIDWVIAGGESGRGARPTHPVWVRALRDQCVGARAHFFFKQWGAWMPVCHVYDAEAPDEIQNRTYRLCDIDYPQIAMDGSGNVYDRCQPAPFSESMFFLRVGKKLAGRQLDGVTISEFPR